MSFLQRIFGREGKKSNPSQSSSITQSSSPEQLIQIVFHTNYYDSNRKEALKIISELPNRDEMIPMIIDQLNTIENREAVVSVLEAIGTPATFAPLLDLFRSAEPSQFIDDGVRVSRVLEPKTPGSIGVIAKGTDRAPACALVEIDPTLERIKSKCLPNEFERILLLTVAEDKPLLYQTLVEMDTPQTVGFLIGKLFNTIENNRLKEQEIVKLALISLGGSALPRLQGAIDKPFSFHVDYDSRPFYDRCFSDYAKLLINIRDEIVNQNNLRK